MLLWDVMEVILEGWVADQLPDAIDRIAPPELDFLNDRLLLFVQLVTGDLECLTGPARSEHETMRPACCIRYVLVESMCVALSSSFTHAPLQDRVAQTGYMRNPIILQALIDAFFKNKKFPGNVYPQYFNPISVYSFTFVLVTVCGLLSLDSVLTSSRFAFVFMNTALASSSRPLLTRKISRFTGIGFSRMSTSGGSSIQKQLISIFLVYMHSAGK